MLIGWGEPTRSYGKTGRYEMGDWTIVVHADLGEQKVLTIILGRTASLPPAPPLPPQDDPSTQAPAAPAQ